MFPTDLVEVACGDFGCGEVKGGGNEGMIRVVSEVAVSFPCVREVNEVCGYCEVYGGWF